MQNYLTAEKKTYYQKEFQKCVVCEDEYWDLDEGLLPILTSINKNPNIQTILSRKPEYIGENNFTSYLFLAYKKNVEKKFFKVEYKLKRKFGIDKIQFWLRTEPPIDMNDPDIDPEFLKEHPQWSEDMKNPNLQHLDCVIKAEEYGDINQFAITFMSDSMKEHDEFWKYLEEILIKIW